MAKTFKDFYESAAISDSKKALNSLKESDTKYIEKRAAKYFIDEDIEEEKDIELDEDTYKKYIKN